MKEPKGAGGGNGGLHIALVSLYHYGAFGSRGLADVLRKNGHAVTLILAISVCLLAFSSELMTSNAPW